MKMQKRKFRIGELAKHLDIEKFVIRFWEKEFGVKTTRSNGGQRFYEESDLERFKLIKKLLYEDGFTIAGAKKQLAGQKGPKVIASQKTTMNEDQDDRYADMEKQLFSLRKQLAQLKKLL